MAIHLAIAVDADTTIPEGIDTRLLGIIDQIDPVSISTYRPAVSPLEYHVAELLQNHYCDLITELRNPERTDDIVALLLPNQETMQHHTSPEGFVLPDVNDQTSYEPVIELLRLLDLDHDQISSSETPDEFGLILPEGWTHEGQIVVRDLTSREGIVIDSNTLTQFARRQNDDTGMLQTMDATQINDVIVRIASTQDWWNAAVDRLMENVMHALQEDS